MNALGIYFGTKDINLVETSANKIVNNIRMPHPKLEISELEEKVPTDIKIIALLKDAFRTYNVKATEVTFCISGHDLVIRTFEIPLLPQSELRSAVSFEAKKYIPFKLEDLDYDFQAFFNKKNKTSLILFVGIKKEILANYVSIAKQLNLKINALEYSAFSLLRLLKPAGLADSGVFANICFDANNEDEANFTVFEDGFSLFSRDFDFSKEPAGFEQTEESDLAAQQEKIKKEIRISFDYYNRKFPDKVVKHVFVVADNSSQEGLKPFFTESSIPVKFVDIQKVLGKGNSYSSVLAKSFAASLYKTTPLKIKINLIGSRLKAAKAAMVNPLAFLEGIKIDLKFVFLGLALCGLAFGYGQMRTQAKQKEIAAIQQQRVKISSTLANDNIETLDNLSAQFKKKIANLDSLVKNQLYLTVLLNSVPRALPEGVWLESFKLAKGNSALKELTLNGQVYLDDSDREFEAVNVLLANLKQDDNFTKYFKEIEIAFIDRKQIQNRSVAVFTIICKSAAEKR